MNSRIKTHTAPCPNTTGNYIVVHVLYYYVLDDTVTFAVLLYIYVYIWYVMYIMYMTYYARRRIRVNRCNSFSTGRQMGDRPPAALWSQFKYFRLIVIINTAGSQCVSAAAAATTPLKRTPSGGLSETHFIIFNIIFGVRARARVCVYVMLTR